MKLLRLMLVILLGCWLGIQADVWAALPPAQTHIQPMIIGQTTTGTLEGMVIDLQYAPIPNVLVKVINKTNGFSYGRRTDANGIYRIEFLPAGTYDIVAQADGYQPNNLPAFLIEVNRSKVIKPPPIVLTPIAAPTPPPTPPQPVLQANIADAALRGSATAEFLTALPLAGIRSFDTFALLIPGVAPAPQTTGASGPGLGAGVGTAGQFSINGQRARDNNFTIDGSDNNDQDVGVRRQGFTATIPQPIETITEFQVTTLLADAEAGRNTGGQINVVSRTGENTIHGQFYDFFNDSALNARNFFDLKIPGSFNDNKQANTRNQLGGTLGFPILKERLTFFGGFERQDLNRNQELHFSVPTAVQRATSLAFANPLIDQTSPLAAFGPDTLALYPLPNNPGGPYGANTLSRVLPASGDATIFTLKLDYQFNLLGKSSTATGRYNFTNDNSRLAAVGNALNSSIDSKLRNQNLAITLNTQLSDKQANQFRFSFGRTALNFREVPGSPFIFQSRPFPGFDGTGDGQIDGLTGPIGSLVVAPFSSIGVDTFTFPQGRANNTFQLADTFVLSFGKHTVKAGADIRRVQFNSFLDRAYRAQATFNSNYQLKNPASGNILPLTGTDLVTLGLPSSFFQTIVLTPDSSLALRFNEVNLFITDNFRLNRRVNLSYGLRYELNTVPKDATGRLEKTLSLDPNSFVNPDSFTVQFLNVLKAQRQQFGSRKEIYDGDKNNFAPRVGIAWDIFGKGRTSVRAGYGLFYDQILGNVVSQSRNIFPNFVQGNFNIANIRNFALAKNNLLFNPAFIFLGSNQQFRAIAPGTINTLGAPPNLAFSILGSLITLNPFSSAFTLPTKNLRTPYVHQYAVSLEQSIADHYVASISYVGSSGRELLRFRSPNGGQNAPFVVVANSVNTFALSLFTRNRPSTVLGPFTVFDNSAESQYHAFQASLVRRASNGLGFQLAYTYAHAIDDVSDLFELAGASPFAQDEVGLAGGLRLERGDANFDVRHRFTAGGQYEIPKVGFLKGLQLAGILTLQTGQPYTVNTSFDINLDGNLTDRLNTLNGLILSDGGRTRIQLAPGVTSFDLLARPSTTNPQNGAVGRNTFRAAGIASLDLALEKGFTIRESQLKLRMEAFNLFNRTHFGIPVRILESPAFGSSVSTSLPSRTIQLVVKYSF